LPTDLKKVTEAVAGDQTGRCALMLNQRIGSHCRSVAEIEDVAGLRGDLGKRFADPARDRMRGISGG
jgi:hypothetical protein